MLFVNLLAALNFANVFIIIIIVMQRLTRHVSDIKMTNRRRLKIKNVWK